MIKKLLFIFVGVFFFFGNVHAKDMEEMERPKGAGGWDPWYSDGYKTKEPKLVKRPTFEKAKGRIQFYRKLSIPGIKKGVLTVKMGNWEIALDELRPSEKEELWNACDAAQRKELRSMYTYLSNAQGDWGEDLYLRMDTYYGAANEWAKMRKEWTRKETVSSLPDAGIKFINELDRFLEVHGDKLKPEDINKLKIQREEIKNFTTLIASWKVFRKRIQIQGVAKLNIMILSDLSTGLMDCVIAKGVISTHHVLVTEALGTAIRFLEIQTEGKIEIDEFVGILNDRIAAFEETLDITIKTYKKMWQEMLEEEEKEEKLDITGTFYECVRKACLGSGGQWITPEESQRLADEIYKTLKPELKKLPREKQIEADFLGGYYKACYHSLPSLYRDYRDNKGCHFNECKPNGVGFLQKNCPATKKCREGAELDLIEKLERGSTQSY